MNNTSQRTAREMRRLEKELELRRLHDCLFPDERSMRNVWRSFRWRELWTALAAFAWIFAMWLVWIWK